MGILGAIANRISDQGQFNQKEIEDEVLWKIREDVDRLIDNILDRPGYQGLPVALQKLLIKQLRNIRSAIINYKLDGVEAMEEAFNGFIGTILVNKDVQEAFSKDGELGTDMATIAFAVLKAIKEGLPDRNLLALPDVLFLPSPPSNEEDKGSS